MISARLSLLLTAAVLPGLASAMSLSEALTRAADHDPSIPVSMAVNRADREASQEDRGSLLPGVYATGELGYTYTKSDGVFGQSEADYPAWSAGVELRQPLFRLDWKARLERADALDERADIGYEQRRLAVMERVAQRYFDVLIAREDLRQIEAELAAVERAALDTRRRFEAKLAPGVDVKEAEARRDLVQARRLAAEVRLETAQDALQETTGAGRAALPALPDDLRFPPLSPAEVDPWLSAAEQHNIDLRHARQAAIIARADRQSTFSQGMPTVDLVARAGRQDTHRFEFGQKADEARVGVELTVPIYSGGIATARLRAAEALAESAAADVRRAQLEVQRLTRSRFRQVQVAHVEIEALSRSVASTEAAEAAARAGYQAGTRTINDLLDAQARVVQARRDYNVTRYSLLLNLIQLKQLTGQLTVGDFGEVDHLLTAQR